MGASVTGGGSGGGDAYLANTQEFTGTNTFDNPIILGVDGSLNGQLRFRDSAGSGFFLTIAPPIAGFSATRAITLPDNGGYWSVVGDNTKSTAVDADAGKIVAMNLSGQVADITAKKLTNGTPAGMYLIHCQLTCTTGVGAASNILFKITGTTEGSSRTIDALSRAMSSTGASSSTIPFQLASGNITWTVTGWSAGTYAIRIRGQYMGT